MSGTYNDGIAERSSHADRAAVAGLTTLAGILLLLSGLWSLFDGLAGIINNKFYVVTPNYAFKIDATAWGWIHLILASSSSRRESGC